MRHCSCDIGDIKLLTMLRFPESFSHYTASVTFVTLGSVVHHVVELASLLLKPGLKPQKHCRCQLETWYLMKLGCKYSFQVGELGHSLCTAHFARGQLSLQFMLFDAVLLMISISQCQFT